MKEIDGLKNFWTGGDGGLQRLRRDLILTPAVDLAKRGGTNPVTTPALAIISPAEFKCLFRYSQIDEMLYGAEVLPKRPIT